MERILVCDPLHARGLELLEASGAEVHRLTGDERPRLAEILPGFDAVVVRSATRLTGELLEAATRLRVVGRAGVGVDNVDLAAATERGVLVINAPTSNIVSATEHTFALILTLARRLAAADAAMKGGTWDRKAFVGAELGGKTLGIIGYGRIGSRVAARARAFEMEVLAFDPFANAEALARDGVTLTGFDDLLARADVVTLHTPLTAETRGLIDAKALARLQPTAWLINCGRGGVVDERALLEALDRGALAGAGLDVLEHEPPTDFSLVTHPRVVATPHIGAQTQEAQERIAADTARMVVAALGGSLAVTAVNLPFRVAPGSLARLGPYLTLGERLGRLAAAQVGTLGESLARVEVTFQGFAGASAAELRRGLAVAVLKGALGVQEEKVNLVNAEDIAQRRGVERKLVVSEDAASFPQLVTVCVQGRGPAPSGGTTEVAGTLFAGRDPRIVRYRGLPLEFQPTGELLFTRTSDVPGVVGRLGAALGQAGINIAGVHLAREVSTAASSDSASTPRPQSGIAVFRLDESPSPDLLAALQSLPEVLEMGLVSFP